jgi:hypothetical protein
MKIFISFLILKNNQVKTITIIGQSIQTATIEIKDLSQTGYTTFATNAPVIFFNLIFLIIKINNFTKIK